MHDTLITISVLLGVGGFVVLVIGAIVIGVVLYRRRSGHADPFQKLGITQSDFGSGRRYDSIVDGRPFQADLQQGAGLMIRVPCRAGANLSIGAKVAIAGLTGSIPPEQEALDLQDTAFAGISVWTDDRLWAEALLDEATRHAVLELLRPGNEIRSIFITPDAVCVRALAMDEEAVTADRMAQWMDDVQRLATHAEAVRFSLSKAPVASARRNPAIPPTLVLV